jgi:hypothetical protein
MQPYKYISLSIALVALLAIIEILRVKRNNQLVISLIAYLLFAFLIFTIGDYSVLSQIFYRDLLLMRKLFEVQNCFFSNTELIFYFIFFKKYHPFKKTARIAFYLIVSYYILFITYLLNITCVNLPPQNITLFSVYLNIYEYAILLFLCITFFYAIIFRPIEVSPIDIYVLNIACALFFYISVSLPFFIISEKINKTYHHLYNLMYAIHFIVLLYSFLTILIIFRKKKSIFYA